MKKYIIPLLIISLLIPFCLAQAQETPVNDAVLTDIKNATLVPYFNALKDGDVTAIKHCLSEDLYKKNSVLLEQNNEYPDFLRNYYRKVNFIIGKAIETDGRINVDVIIEFPNGDRNPTKLVLLNNSANYRDRKGPAWVITEFIY